MSVVVPVETAKRELDTLLDRLSLGETVTLVDADGHPRALIVQLQSLASHPTESPEEWFAQLDDLAKRIDAAWTSNKGAVDTLIEMRR